MGRVLLAGDPLFDISGKVALVTGGTSGIGLMIARGFARRGVRTYIASRDQGRADATAAEVSALGDCRGLAADLDSEGGAATLAAALAQREEKLDILVNNAGATAPGGELDKMTPAAWDLLMNVNLKSLFFLTQHVLPLLTKAASPDHAASIINIGSIGGLHVPNWEAHAYGASKAAVHHLTRSLAKRFWGQNIRVNAIAPGPFPSRLNDVNSEGTQRAIKTYIPAARAGTEADLEGLAVFLASRASAYVNGHTIPLDGGYIAAL